MITNAYGVGERSPRMVNTTIQKCIRGEAPQFTAGTQNYDFVYIDIIFHINDSKMHELHSQL